MFTIGQVSDMFHIPISTLRYYDKEGCSPAWNAPPASAGSEKRSWRRSG